MHRTAEVAKAIVRAYYGSDSAYAYFLGCSNGGRQALMEAQRFPADFDGIVSGAPAYDFTRIAASFVTHAKATFPDPGNLKTSTVSPSDLALVAAAALDTLRRRRRRQGRGDRPADVMPVLARSREGLSERRRGGRLPDHDEPRGAGAHLRADCRAVGRDLPGPTGRRRSRPGRLAGVDHRRRTRDCSAGTGGRVPSLRYGFGTEFFKYFVFGDPAWDYRRFDVATWADDTRVAATILNADSVDLAAFKQRKGKLLLWHGWADPPSTPQSTINYYERLKAADPQAPDFARLFLMPGVLHCAGGAGPDSVEWIDAIAAWTEKGAAPERVIATKRGADGTPTRTRPLCPHPQRAVYNGTGSTDDAANFTCKG